MAPSAQCLGANSVFLFPEKRGALSSTGLLFCLHHGEKQEFA